MKVCRFASAKSLSKSVICLAIATSSVSAVAATLDPWYDQYGNIVWGWEAGPDNPEKDKESIQIGYKATAGGSQGSSHSVVIGSGASTSNAESGVALGNLAAAQARNAVALGAGSVADKEDTVSVGSGVLKRKITNVAAGTDDTDAVNVLQLKKAGLLDERGQIEGVLVYDAGKNRTSVTLGGLGASSQIALTNVAGGRIGEDSTDAVNGGQIFKLTQRVDKLEAGPHRDGQPSDGPKLDKKDVNLHDIRGKLTNVTAGVDNTDAANVGQLNTAVADGLHQAQTYTDGKVGALRSEFDQKIDHNRKDALGGTAAAIAIANLPQAYPGESMVSVAGGNFGGQSAGAIGVSTSTQKWAVKASFTADTRGSYGGGLGAGYRF